jgi:hypothetical protein
VTARDGGNADTAWNKHLPTSFIILVIAKPARIKIKYSSLNARKSPMGDLYDQLEEPQGMTHTLDSDVDYLRPKLGPKNIQQELSDNPLRGLLKYEID